MRVLLILSDADARHGHVIIVVETPEFVGNGVGVVRVRHRHGQAKRLPGRVAHMVIQILVCTKNHVVVKVELVGAHAGACL